jgi:bifunctional DNase/RNase
MLEMTVRTVDHDPKSGSPVAVLLPRDRADGPPMALPIRSAEACSLTHELEGQLTPRARAFALLTQTLAAIRGYVAAIVVEPGDDGDPIATVRVRLPDGWCEHRTDAASALGLAVYTLAPLLVSEHLAHTTADVTSGEQRPASEDQAHLSPVPAPFLQALDE